MKMINPIFNDYFERVVTCLSVKEKRECYFYTCKGCCPGAIGNSHQAYVFFIETDASQAMTGSGRCYTPDELALAEQKKDQAKRPISKGEAEDFQRRMKPKDYSIVKHLEKTLA